MERPVVADDFAPLHPGSDRAERPVIVEVLGSHGQVRHRTRLTTLPAVIGRGYDCDVMLDDPHVCARHAELRRDDSGALVLRDLDSVNGIGSRGTDAHLEQMTVASGDRVRVGSVEIRIIEGGHPVAPALRLGSDRRLTTGISGSVRALAVCGGAFLASALLNYQASVASEALVGAVQESVYILAAMAMWAGGWALVTRVVSKGFRFLEHWAWALGIVIVGLTLSAVGEWIDFLGPSWEMGTWIAAAGGLALLPVFFSGHLEIASNMSHRRRWRSALTVGAVVIGVTVIASLGSEDDPGSIDFAGTLKPLPARLIPGVTLDQFMESAEALKADVDALADEAVPDDAPIGDDAESVPDTGAR